MTRIGFGLLIPVLTIVPTFAISIGLPPGPQPTELAGAVPHTDSSAPVGEVEQPHEARLATPPKSLFNDDGILDLTTGFSGSVGPTGWRMLTGREGKPCFVRAGDANRKSANKQSPLVAGDAQWDARFREAGIGRDVYAIAVSGSDVYVGGAFTITSAGGVPPNRIAKWDATAGTWSAPGTGTDNTVYAIAVNATDFSILRASFGKALGDPGYGGRADFNHDSLVAFGDFNLLRSTFGQGGASLTCP